MKKVNIIGIVVLLLIVLVSCDSYTFEPYSYTNEPPIKSDVLPDFINCDGMVVDGEKEVVYGESVNRLYYKNKENNPIYVDSYLYFGETGIHCFVEVHDDIISYVGTRSVYYNSSVELFFNDWNKNYIDGDTLQYRISAGESFTKHIGLRKESSYATGYFDGVFKVKLLGEFFQPGAEGFNVEVFIPWYELGFNSVDEVDGLMYMVAYNSVHDTSGDSAIASRSRTAKMLGFQATPYTWIPVEKQANNSGENIITDGVFFGKNDVYDSSYGFDFSNDSGPYTGKAILNKESTASYTFVKDYSGTNYYYEVYISDVGGTPSKHPKIGITTFILSNRITLYIKLNEKNRCGITQRNDANSDWNWTVEEGGTYTNEDFVNADDNFPNCVKLATYRKDDLLCFFVNDKLLFATKNAKEVGIDNFKPEMRIILHGTETVDDYNEESILGIYSYGATAKLSDYYLLQGIDADSKFISLLNKNN